MKIGRLLFAISSLLLLLQPAGAQITIEKLRTAPEDATSLFHPYPDAPGVDTPAPAGYKPFYISHYGRHGSRYETNKATVEMAPSKMKQLDEKGLLSEKGKTLYAFLQTVVDESRGRWGELTGLGAAEHKAIANRMVKRFAPVFGDKSRQDVRCTASTSTRCVVSMASATGEIRSLAPDLYFSYNVGERFQPFMRSTGGFPKNLTKSASEQKKRKLDAELDPLKAGSAIFTSAPEAIALIPNPTAFFESVYCGWAIHLAMGLPFFDIREYIDEASLMTLWGAFDGRLLYLLGHPSADKLIEEILVRADEALAGESVCADLRYGHDNMLLRLVNQFGLGKWHPSLAEANAEGDMAGEVPMGSNLQIVFYRARKGDVLVKVLYNEIERTLPGLEAVSGPYYRWTDVREAWSKLVTNNQ